MINLFLFLILLILFYFLGKSADLVIINTKRIGQKLGLNLFFLGLILGFFTSLPEMGVAINALINNVPSLSVGNLWGSFFVLFGLILGASAFLNRRIITDGQTWSILPILFLLLVPIFLALDGNINLMEGLFIITFYFGVILYLLARNIKLSNPTWADSKNRVLKNIFFIFLGLALVAVISHFVMEITLILLSVFAIPAFVVGLVLFAIGTNLPEITVAIRSWQNHIKDLSLSNLLGSAMANSLIIGIMAVLKPLSIEIDIYFFYLICTLMMLFVCLLFFYKSKKSISRLEGLILITFYLLFLIGQIYLLSINNSL